MTSSATLAENVADVLRHAISIGSYLSGERLVELALAQELHVSQNTIRDGLNLLAQEGWIVKHTRRGVYVRTFTPEEALELYALRAVLEPLALAWALPDRYDPAHLAALAEQISTAQQHVYVGNWKGAQEALFAFHTLIPLLARKMQTAEVLSRLHNGARLLENLRELRAPRGEAGWNACLQRYQHLLREIEQGNASRAQNLLAEIITGDGAQAAACLHVRL